MTKSDLRSHFRNIRKDFVLSLKKSEIEAAQTALAVHVEQAARLPRTIAGYLGIAPEFDPLPILARWRDEGHAIALPSFVSRGSQMEFKLWDDGLETGPMMGIPQPHAGAPDAEPELLLVPLVAADLAGNRIGQGGGHYDRALAAMRAQRPVIAIGVAWDCQIAETLPVEPWDQPLDFIATPERLIEVTS